MLVAAVALAGCNAGNPPPAESEGDYVSQIQVGARGKRRRVQKTAKRAGAPVKVNEFLPLKYFPPDPEYVVPASLNPAKERIVVEMLTSQGKARKHQRVGVLEFTLKGQPLTLGAFVEAGAGLNRLFVPFSDMTSGTETYPAGRYLELDRTSSGVYTIDFNKAYNPYCYYNPSYDCPYPPRESRLAGAHSRRRTSTLSTLQAVFFDFDGVIADTEPLHLRAYQAVLQADGIDLNKTEYYARYLGYDDLGLFEALAKDRRISLSDEKIEAWVVAKSCIIEELLTSDAILFPGAAACVKMFAEQVPLAVASGALEPEIEIVLEHAGLRSAFAAIASASDGVRGKPAPDLYLLAMAKLRGRLPDAVRSRVMHRDRRFALGSRSRAPRGASLCGRHTHLPRLRARKGRPDRRLAQRADTRQSRGPTERFTSIKPTYAACERGALCTSVQRRPDTP